LKDALVECIAIRPKIKEVRDDFGRRHFLTERLLEYKLGADVGHLVQVREFVNCVLVKGHRLLTG
jgi:hypothetical protein